MFDLPPPEAPASVPHECVISAAAALEVPPESLVLIRKQEAGHPGTESRNANGTYDLGVMQINTIHVARMHKEFGIDRNALVNDACASVFAAAILLREHINRNQGDVWKSIGDYHSRTPQFHDRYRSSVATRYHRLRERYPAYVQWLQQSVRRARGSLSDGQIATLPRPMVVRYGIPEKPVADTGVSFSVAPDGDFDNPLLSRSAQRRSADAENDDDASERSEHQRHPFAAAPEPRSTDASSGVKQILFGAAAR